MIVDRFRMAIWSNWWGFKTGLLDPKLSTNRKSCVIKRTLIKVCRKSRKTFLFLALFLLLIFYYTFLFFSTSNLRLSISPLFLNLSRLINIQIILLIETEDQQQIKVERS